MLEVQSRSPVDSAPKERGCAYYEESVLRGAIVRLLVGGAGTVEHCVVAQRGRMRVARRVAALVMGI